MQRPYVEAEREGDMSKVTSIHPSKQPRRPHYIKEWAEKHK